MAHRISKLLPALACLWAVSGLHVVQATDINLSGTVVGFRLYGGYGNQRTDGHL